MTTSRLLLRRAPGVPLDLISSDETFRRDRLGIDGPFGTRDLDRLGDRANRQLQLQGRDRPRPDEDGLLDDQKSLLRGHDHVLAGGDGRERKNSVVVGQHLLVPTRQAGSERDAGLRNGTMLRVFDDAADGAENCRLGQCRAKQPRTDNQHGNSETHGALLRTLKSSLVKSRRACISRPTPD